MVTRAPRLLVKAKPTPEGTNFNIGKTSFRLEPLVPHRPQKPLKGMAQIAEWHLTDIPTDIDEVNPWDLCHQLQSKGLGIPRVTAVKGHRPDGFTRT